METVFDALYGQMEAEFDALFFDVHYSGKTVSGIMEVLGQVPVTELEDQFALDYNAELTLVQTGKTVRFFLEEK